MPNSFSFTEKIFLRISRSLLNRLDRAVEADETVNDRSAWLRIAIVEKLERDELTRATGN